MCLGTASATLLVLAAAPSIFDMVDDGARLTVSENGKPVFTCNYAPVSPPEGSAEAYGRDWTLACFFHPVHGLDGDVLTEAFPDDHPHHRGIYWAWPRSVVGDRPADVWMSKDIHQVHDRWTEKTILPDRCRLTGENVWVFRDDPDSAPPVRERFRVDVHPADGTGRLLEFELQLVNESEQLLELKGAGDEKGYGGFCVRPDSGRAPLTFTTALGLSEEDALDVASPWAAVSFAPCPDGQVSGVAVFQHPTNPGYPHPGWILRHYGFLGASWPHLEPHVLEPGASVTLRYGVFLHRGTAEEADVAGRFAAFTGEAE